MNVLFIPPVLGLLLSVSVHVLTLVGTNPEIRWPLIWLLHLGVLISLALAIVARGVAITWRSRKRERWPRRVQVTRPGQYAPVWLKAFVGTTILYTLATFLYVNLYLMEGGVPAEIDGQLVLHSHSNVIRRLTSDEFEQQKLNSLRGFSAAWICGYGFSLMMLVDGIEMRRALSRTQLAG